MWRLNSDLERKQKLQLGMVAGILLLTGVTTWRNWDHIMSLFGVVPPDRTVTSWVECRKYGANTLKPITADNPEDVQQRAMVTAFAGHDGKLLIIEHPQNPTAQPQIVFEPDRRRHIAQDFLKYRDQMARVARIGNETRRAITLAAYLAAPSHPGSPLNSAGLTADQRKDEQTARTEMLDGLEHINNQVFDGSFDAQRFQDMLDLIAKYKQDSEDPLKSPAKQQMARQIMDMGMKFLAEVDDAKAGVIEKYVDAVDQLLDGGQRQKLADSTRVHLTPHKRMQLG